MCGACGNAGYADQYGLPGMARTLHERCEWPATCTCQHAVGGDWINGERARGLPHA